MKNPSTLPAARKLVAGLGFKPVNREKEGAVSFLHAAAGVEVLARPRLIRVYSRTVPMAKALKSLKLEPAPMREGARSKTPRWAFGLVVTDENAEAVRTLIEGLCKDPS
ncbi:MAG TPA: hypothetical protein VIM33_16310 [Gaiellaceae bacterium]|jgi:hypothetical protein